MRKLFDAVVAFVALAFIVFVMWTLKWWILGGAVLFAISVMVYESVTGKKTRFSD